ncbi:agouti-related protein-like [Betta splendens]|uniref:Agouti-related protein-like n=1 Tax=Betta splendens TaxID=158456 RepID=A0A6P7M3K6_BETSP|nr:agouti-related protein-like [Betta splendens]
MIKVAVLSLCLCVSAGLFTRKEDETSRNSLSAGGVDAAQSSGYVSKGRRRPLFARRGQYERQEPRVLKHSVASGFPDNRSSASKVSKTTKPKCSELSQSCLPTSRCCDPCSTCHCRFFKAICFCRRTEGRKDHRQK